MQPVKAKKNTITAISKYKLYDEVQALKEENRELRAALGMDQAAHTLESWESIGSQSVRDGLAARAFMAEWGSTPRALQRLGFAVINERGQWKPKVVAEIAKHVFETPGVQAILAIDPADAEQTWKQIVERQRRTAISGDDQLALKAGQFVAKVEGRHVSGTQSAPVVSLHVLVNNNKSPDDMRDVTPVEVTATNDPLAILSHEPSPLGVRITTGDKAIDSMLGADK